MRIVVTGGAGFIGSNFIRYWLQRYPEDYIVNLDKLTYAGRRENLSDLEKDNNYEFVRGDICDYKAVEKTTKDSDLIVHFAAESHVDRSIEGPFPFIKTNIEGTLNLLEAAKQNGGIRFHHVSTDEVFGTLPLDKPELKFTEDTPYQPRSPYSASKASSDMLVRAYFDTYKLPATISNCSNNYGPYQFPEKLIPIVITRALNDEEIPVYGDGKQIRDWIHVEDHCRGIESVIKKGSLGETYLFGGNAEKENIWIAKYILNALGKSEDLIVYVGDRKGHDHRYAIDFSKATKELGYTPEMSIETGLDQTIAWYKENEAWWKELKPQADKIAQKYLANRQD